MNISKQNQLYANLMHEVKVRIEVIEASLNGRMGYSEFFVREFCWLQLRMLCELIALSCLVAHGDITFLQPHRVGRSTSAEEILGRLTKLRSHFYPLATEQVRTLDASGRTNIDLRVVDPSPLSKGELLQLYGASHRHVHRGSLKKLLSMSVDVPLDVKINAPEILNWTQKINRLLSCHTIAIDSDSLIMCVLRNASDNYNVQVATAKRSELLKS
jgi:hypothetical protein